jgi:hypothetical protein
MWPVMTAALVQDVLWDLIEPLLTTLPQRPKGGRPRVPDRACLTAFSLSFAADCVADAAAGTRLRL